MWVQIIVAIAMAVLSYALTPKAKTKTNTLKPQEVTVPTVTAGSPVQVVFGRVRVRNPNILWYGNQSSSAIRK